MTLTDVLSVFQPLAVIIAFVSLIYVVKNSKKSNEKDVEARATGMAKIEVKLDAVIDSVTEIKSDLKCNRTELNDLAERIAKAESSIASAHHRIDELAAKE